MENHPLEELKDIRDIVIPHAIDPERYTDTYKHNLSKEWTEEQVAILLCTLNWVEDPFTFIQAMKSAPNTRGLIIGDGVMKSEVESLCEVSRGQAMYIGSRNRLQVPSILKAGQIGVACLHEKSRNNRQLKILEYCAAGLFPLVSNSTFNEGQFTMRHFRDVKELIGKLNELCGVEDKYIESKNMILKRNRQLVEENWNARKWSKVFNEKLEEKL